MLLFLFYMKIFVIIQYIYLHKIMLENYQLIITLIIFFATFWVMITEKAHRSVIAFFGAVVMGIMWTSFWYYTPESIIASIDFNTILLLLWMMVIVTELEKTWFLQYLAILVAKKTHGNTGLLLLWFAGLTSVLSMFLDNVTTIILVVPITLIVTKILKINPVPILLAEAVLSNIAWVGTLIWDPPNIIIGSAAWFSFTDFLFHTFPVVILIWFLVLLYIRHSHKKWFTTHEKGIKSIQKMDANKCLQNPIILRKTLIVLFSVILLFFIHEYIGLPASWVAMLGASALLLWVSPHKDPKSIFKKVELSVLVFFASLFVLVWWLEAVWILDILVDKISYFADKNIILTAIVILWSTALLSAFIDNIPMTVAMIPVIAMLEQQWIPGVEILWWALAFWVGFWWNISPIWSTAWVIIMWKAESNKTPVEMKQWLQIGIPSTLIALIVSSCILIIFAEYFMY